MPRNSIVGFSALVIIPIAFYVRTARQRASHNRVFHELLEAIGDFDIRELKRILAEPNAEAVADTRLDHRGRTAYDFAKELRFHEATRLLRPSKVSLEEKRRTENGDVRKWQSDRIVDLDRSTLTARMRWPSVRLPAVSVLVVQADKTLYERVDGYTDMAKGTMADAETRFLIGSVTKQFVAAAIMRLQDDGALDVRKDKLARWYPQYPRAEQVTLEHLLTHTSGIREYYDYLGILTKQDRRTEEEMVAHMQRLEYAFEPGERWSYSNSGYYLLGFIVQRVSGKSLHEYLRDTFFIPLGMTRTGMHSGNAEEYAEDHTIDGLVGYRKAIVPAGRTLLRGTPYAPNPYKMALSTAPGGGGAGAMFSTARDLLRWNKALFEDMSVISKPSLHQALTRFVLNNGTTTAQYGYGLALTIPEEAGGVVCYQHGGGMPGYTAKLEYFPDRNMSIVVLSNTSGGKRAAHYISQSLHDIWSHDMRSEIREIPDRNESISKEQLKKFVGTYDFRASRDIDLLEISENPKTGELAMFGWGSSPLIPVAENSVIATRFEPVIKLTMTETTAGDIEIIAERDSPGRKTLYGKRQQPKDICATYDKRSLTKSDHQMLNRCCGRYDYGYPDVVIRRNRFRRNRLIANVAGAGGVSLIHMGGSRFCFDGYEPMQIVEFVFDEDSNEEGDSVSAPSHLVLYPPTEFPYVVKRLADA